MPLTILDPQTALVVVDLQKGLRDIPSLHPMAGVIDYSCQLIKAFRKQKLPVVLVNVAGPLRGGQRSLDGTESSLPTSVN